MHDYPTSPPQKTPPQLELKPISQETFPFLSPSKDFNWDSIFPSKTRNHLVKPLVE